VSSTSTTDATRAQRPVVLARVGGVLTTLVALGLALAVLMAGALMLAGYRPTTEHSNSMAPNIHRGDVLFSRALSASQVRLGDVITFPDPNFKGVLLTHRVRAEQALADGRIAFTTRGDANTASEYWTTRAGGRLTRLSFDVPHLGAMLMTIGAHPLYVAIAIVLSLWLMILQFVWRPRAGTPPARGGDSAPPRRGRRKLALLGVGVALVLVPTATAAVGLVAAPHASETPSSTLVVNDQGRPLFDLPVMRPGETASACELVRNEGPAPTGVGIYSSATGTGLQRFLDLRVMRGTLPSGASPGSCSGFSADRPDYQGLGRGVIYSGLMSAFPSTAEAALIDPALAWPAGQSVGYEMTVALAESNAAQGFGAVQRFYFGSPGKSGYVPPVEPLEPVRPPAPGTPTAPAPPVEELQPITAPAVGAISDGVSPNGNLTISFNVSGKGSVIAVASLVRTVTLRVTSFSHGRRTTRMKATRRLTLLGRGSLTVGHGGRATIVFKPLAGALHKLRATPRRYRIRVTLSSHNGAAAPSAITVWVSAKSLGIFATGKPPKH
jgi:signal peptidase I